MQHGALLAVADARRHDEVSELRALAVVLGPLLAAEDLRRSVAAVVVCDRVTHMHRGAATDTPMHACTAVTGMLAEKPKRNENSKRRAERRASR